MTTEEIEKAAITYDRELKTRPISSVALREDLVNFGQIINNHWQEKTRWKLLLDEPPKEPKPFEEVYLLLKHSDGGYAIKLSVSQNSVNYWLSEGFIAWKEIE